jgi:hypothetical protein
MLIFPSIIQESNQCKDYFHLFKQCHEQFHLFNKRIQEKCKFYIIYIYIYSGVHKKLPLVFDKIIPLNKMNIESFIYIYRLHIQ